MTAVGDTFLIPFLSVEEPIRVSMRRVSEDFDQFSRAIGMSFHSCMVSEACLFQSRLGAIS